MGVSAQETREFADEIVAAIRDELGKGETKRLEDLLGALRERFPEASEEVLRGALWTLLSLGEVHLALEGTVSRGK